MDNQFIENQQLNPEVPQQQKNFFSRYRLPIILGVLIIVFVIGGFFGWRYFVQSEIEPPTATVTEQAGDIDEFADWNTYVNNLYGYQIKYPNEWSILGTGPTIYDPCVNDALNQQIVTITQENVDCENEKEFDELEVILIIGIEDTEWNEDDFRPPFFETIELEEIRGWTIGGKPCSLPTGCMKTIYFNHNGKGFGITATPVDGAVNYDYSVIFNQILSTFRFIE